MRDSRVMVTGGAGFIGSELVRQLANECTEVLVIDNLVNGRRENLDGVKATNIRLIMTDIRYISHMADLMRRVDVVFHLACLGVRHSIHSPHENHEVNATATLNLLSAAKEVAVKRFVYVSSSEVYGTAQQVPMTEEHPTFPMTIYGASKLAGECYTRAFHRTYGYPTVVVRPFNTYGPRCHHEGDSGEVIPKFLLRCLLGQPMIVFGDGTQTRDFTYVSDTARGILLAGFSDACIGDTINLGSGKEISITNLAGEIAQLAGRPQAAIVCDRPRPGDVLRLYADVAKAKRALGFEPVVALKDGLALLMRWYIDSGRKLDDLLNEEVVHNWEGRASSNDR
jgi:UDP-glucose 4-epimerase